MQAKTENGELRKLAGIMTNGWYPKLGTESRVKTVKDQKSLDKLAKLYADEWIDHVDREELDARRESKHDQELSEYHELRDWTLRALEQFSQSQKTIARKAFIFASKAPAIEREDLFQSLFATLWAKQSGGKLDEKLAHKIAHDTWANWWKSYYYREHYSLDVTQETDDNELSIDIPDDRDLISEAESDIDASILWQSLPQAIQAIARKRIKGTPLTIAERQRLSRYARANSFILDDIKA